MFSTPLRRRRFLAASAAVAAGGGLAACGVRVPGLGIVGTSPSATRRTTPTGSSAGTSANGPVVVSVFLAGGNDGLDTVVPRDDPAYRDLRGELAIDPATTHDLGGGFGFHPKLVKLSQMFAAKRLAVVHGVGYPKPRLSHFESMAIWHSADPDARTPTGWLGRWLDAETHDPLRAISIGTQLSPSLIGAKWAGSAVDPNATDRAGTGVVAAWRALAATTAQDTLAGAFAGSVTDLARLEQALAPALGKVGVPDDGDPANGGESPTAAAALPKAKGAGGRGGRDLAGQLRTAAAIIDASVGTRAVTVSLGGFDTHGGEAATHERLMGEVDDAVGEFWDTIAAGPRADDVTMLIWSEFGRRPRYNGSGTDHGTAAPVLLIGPKVKGGHHGTPPSLTKLDDNANLVATGDFRDVYAAVLAGVLGADPGDIVGSRSAFDVLTT